MISLGKAPGEELQVHESLPDLLVLQSLQVSQPVHKGILRACLLT